MLTDPFGRAIEYIRVSVTDRCDLRCTYCMPVGFKDFEEPEHWLTFDELERLLGLFARLGTRRIRLTGGEPLLRWHVTDLAARLARLDGEVAYTTGLLHNLGTLGLMSAYPDEYSRMLEVSNDFGFDLLQTERDLFEIDHLSLIHI